MRLLSLSLCVCALGTAPMLHSSEETGEKPNLEEVMKDMGKAQRALNKALKGQDAAAANAALAEMTRTTTASKDLLPKEVAALPEGEARTAAVANYQGLLDKLLAGIQATKTAVEAGDWATAEAGAKDLNVVKKEGHDAYKPE